MESKFVNKAGFYLYSDEQNSTWFYNGIVKGQQLFPLCRQDIPSIMIPWDFFVPFKVRIPVEEIITGLEDCAFDEAVQRAYTRERNNLRSGKERPRGLNLQTFQGTVARR